MKQDVSNLTLSPESAVLNNMTVTAVVRSIGTSWEVIIVFSRHSEQSAMFADDLWVGLYDERGAPLALVQTPEGLLPEFGGGLGSSVNARYLFEKHELPAARLMVRHKSEQAAFQLMPH